MGSALALSIVPLALGQSDQTCGADSKACGSSWRAFRGCAIPAGDDLSEASWVTIKEAKGRCETEVLCQGFTFEGLDPEGHGNPVWVHFKKSFDCVDADWIAWRKLPLSLAPAPPEGPWEADGAPERGVALCLLGQVRMLSHTHQAMEQHLLQTLQPDVFLYGPSEGNQNPELYSLKAYVVEQQWEEEDIRQALYAETRDGRMMDDYMQVQGNWFGNQCLDPPLQDQRPGSAICSYYSQNKCLKMILAKEQQRGARYRHVVVSRFDFRWLAPHPPLELLDNEAIWIPSGSDWEGGINDRHAVVPRQHAEVYLGAWKLLTTGDAVEVMRQALGPRRVQGYPGPNTENFLLARLRYFEVPFQRFPSVAFLVCTLRSKSRWTQCFGSTSMDGAGWLYKEEMEHATRIAKCIRSSWSSSKMNECQEDISHLYRGLR